MSLTTTRQDLADALKDAGYSVYAYPMNQMFAPAVVLVPSTPYVGWDTPNRRWAKYNLTLMVVNNDNQAALTNMEKMIDDLSALLPTFCTITEFSQPSIEEVGSTDYLVSDITVQLTIN
jgi:hypothetical protein